MLEKAIAREPRLLPAYGLLARDYLVRFPGEAGAGKATALLERGIAASPGAWELQLEIGNTYAATERHEQAVSAFRKALELGAGDEASVHYNLANSLNSLGRIPEALAAYERAIELAPTHFNARRNQILTLRQADRLEEALLHAREMLNGEWDEEQTQWLQEAVKRLSEEHTARTLDAVTERIKGDLLFGLNLKFEISGTVATVLVQKGQSVEAGRALAEIDSREFELELQRCESDIAQHQATSGVMTQEERIRKKTRESLDALLAKKEVATRNLAATVLRAPVAGKVLQVLAEVGQPVQAGKCVIILKAD